MSPHVVKLLTIVVGVATIALSRLVPSAAELLVGIGGIIIGSVLPEVGKLEPKETKDTKEKETEE